MSYLLSPIVFATLLEVLLLGLLFTYQPTWGLMTFIFSLPFERIGSYPLNPVTDYPLIHPAQIVGLALIGAYFLRFITGQERPRHIPAFYFLLLFLGTSIISAIRVNISPVWSILAWLFFIITLFWVVAQLATRERLSAIKWSMVAALGVVSLFGIYQFFGDLAGLSPALTGIRLTYSKAVLGFPRLQSTALEPLYFADYLFLPIFTLLALVIYKNQKKLLWGALGIGVIAFALTFSRGAAASGIVGLIVLMICLKSKIGSWTKAHIKPVGALAAVLLIVLAVIVVVSEHSTKNSRTGDTILKNYFTTQVFKTATVTERARDQRLALKIFREHPIFGVGIGGFGSAYYGCRVGKCVYRPNIQALEVLAEGGIVGFTTFHLFLLMLIWYGWRALKKTTGEQKAIIAGLLAATVAMIVQSQTFSGFLCCLTYTWGTLGILGGLSATIPAETVKGDG